MASVEVRRLAVRLTDDERFRQSFRADPHQAVEDAGYALTLEELGALDQHEWAVMSDEELLVRLAAVSMRGTHQAP